MGTPDLTPTVHWLSAGYRALPFVCLSAILELENTRDETWNLQHVLQRAHKRLVNLSLKFAWIISAPAPLQIHLVLTHDAFCFFARVRHTYGFICFLYVLSESSSTKLSARWNSKKPNKHPNQKTKQNPTTVLNLISNRTQCGGKFNYASNVEHNEMTVKKGLAEV